MRFSSDHQGPMRRALLVVAVLAALAAGAPLAPRANAAPTAPAGTAHRSNPARPARSAPASRTSAARAAAAARGSRASAAWTPEPATYGAGHKDVYITAADGTILHAIEYYPTNPATGAPAPGPFPVLLTQTPYGAIIDELGAPGNTAALVGKNPYLVGRGYIELDADVRGTGSSTGTWGLFDPVQGEDGADWVRYAARLAGSDGKVGLFGASYLGIDQFATAVDAGPSSPVKAMFPIISATDVYRDESFAGGFPSLEFNLPYLGGLVPGLSLTNPVLAGGPTLLQAIVDHLGGELEETVPLLANVIGGGADAYDGDYWTARNPVGDLAKIVSYRIPAFLVGGWFDLFQRGEPLNYAGLQNAYAGRPVLAPMDATQPVTGRYQLIDGPWYHVTAGTGLDYRDLDLNGVELAWFDHWLKGIDTGIQDTSTPLHVYDLGARRWDDTARYPFAQATPATYYLGPGGALTTNDPASASGTDTLPWQGVSLACANEIEQWSAGLGVFALQYVGLTDPCTTQASLAQTGPGTVNFTTAPFTSATTLAGPIGATLYATANTKETEWAVSISDVSPDGTARQLTEGVLAGSLRSLDPADSWYAPDGLPILPYHPYTQASQAAVVPGELTRYDVEVFPTFDTLLPGHRLRVTIATSDVPHVVPDVPQLANLLGGVYQLEMGPGAPSSVELPLAPESNFTDAAPPVATVSAPRRASGQRFTVRWSGTHPGGAGIDYYTVEVARTSSHRGGTAAHWRMVGGYAATTRRALVFKGRTGGSYRFRVRATDLAGDVGSWATSRGTVTGEGRRG
jgi:putative CocE/NonD family hydrolase